MDMKVSSDEIRSYVRANQRVAKQELPEESRRLVLRLPVDGVFISPEARALKNARLRVRVDAEGRYEKISGDDTDEMMKIVENGMREARKILGHIKKLTTLMEDEKLTDEDRYAKQMELADLEAEFEKRVYRTFYDHNKLFEDEPGGKYRVFSGRAQMSGMYRDAFGSNIVSGTADAWWEEMKDWGRDIFAYKKQATMVDKVNELRKEAMHRVRMRETDPEMFREYEEKLREGFRAEYREKVETGEIVPVLDVMPKVEVDQADGVVEVFPEVDALEYQMEEYAEEKLAELESADYGTHNAVRISVMSASLARESDDYVDVLTEKLTEQYERFTAVHELVTLTPEEQEVEAPEDRLERERLIKKIVHEVLTFLDGTLLKEMTSDDTVRREKGGYNVKVEKRDNPMDGVRDIFAPVALTPEEIWQMHRPDLFGSAEA